MLLSDLEEAGVQALEVRNMKLQIVPATEVVVFSKELDHSCEGSQVAHLLRSGEEPSTTHSREQLRFPS